MGCGDEDCKYCPKRARSTARARSVRSGSKVKRDRSGRTIRGWSKRQLLRSELFIAGHLSLQVQGVEREAESDYRQHREHHQDAPAHGRTSGSLARTTAMPAAIDCAT